MYRTLRLLASSKNKVTNSKVINSKVINSKVINSKVIDNLKLSDDNLKLSDDNIKIIIDKPEYWFMMGYFIGDGWIQDSVKSDGRSKNCIYFAINDNDINDINDIVRNISLVIPITDKKRG